MFFHKDFPHIDDHGPQVDAARTYQCAFAAKHALFQVVAHFVELADAEQIVVLADVELGEMTGRAGGRAAAAVHAALERGNCLLQLADGGVVAVVQIDGPCLVDSKAERIGHSTLFFV